MRTSSRSSIQTIIMVLLAILLFPFMVIWNLMKLQK